MTMNKSTGFKMAFFILGLLLCTLLAKLVWDTKFLRIMSDERVFLHYGFSGLFDWMSFDASANPYIAYSKTLSLFLKAINPEGLRGVVYLSKLFAVIPTALLLGYFIFIVRSVTKAHWPVLAYVLLASMILLVFATTGRMVEVRPDSLSIPLFCAANLTLYFAMNPSANWRPFAVAAVLFILAAWFSLRAAMMILLMSPIYLFILRSRLQQLSWSALIPIGVSLGTILLLILIFQFNPLDVINGQNSHEAQLTARHHSLTLKFLQQDRLTVLVFQGAFALLGLGVLLKSREKKMRAIASIGIALIIAQFILIFIDPAPYLYAYSLGLSGVLMILLSSIETLSVRRGLYVCTFALAIVQSMHVLAPNGRNFGVQIHAGPIDRVATDFAGVDTPTLISTHLKSGTWHINDQIAVASALCERVNGKAIVQFHVQPMCIENALENDKFRAFLTIKGTDPEERSVRAILSAIDSQDTKLVLWQPGRVNETILGALEASSDWTLYDGFALRK